MNIVDITQCEYEFAGLELYQPSLYDLAKIFKEEENLMLILKLLIFPVKDSLGLKKENLNEFQVFLGLLATDTSSFGLTVHKKAMFLKFINLLFKGFKMSIIKESIVFEKEDQIITLDGSNFDYFKEILKRMFNIPELFENVAEKKYNPKDARAARIAKMLEESQKKIAEQNPKTKKGIIENYITVLSIGLQIPPSILSKELTLYNLFNLHRRFIMKSSWDLDIDCRLAGASPKDSPDNWMSLF